jgi:LmbE family N-acetylglucosaminyl deacetylase
MFKRILALGAHPDDVEFGCAGALEIFRRKGAMIKYIVFSKCTDLPRNKGIEIEWEKAIKKIGLNRNNAELLDFPNRLLYTYEALIREKLEEIREVFNPQLVFTHSPDDVHQDHNCLREECQKVFKSCTLLGYESPRSSVKFNPDFYIVVPGDIAEKKRDIIDCYESQKALAYSNPEKILAAMKYHGTKINAQYAEAFNLIRGVLKF